MPLARSPGGLWLRDTMTNDGCQNGPATWAQVAERLAGARACLAALQPDHAATPHLRRLWTRRIGELEDLLRATAIDPI